MYSRGESERVVGQALRDFAKRDEYVIASKVHPTVGGRDGVPPPMKGLTRKRIFSAVQGSLERLGMDFIDLYIVHKYANPQLFVALTFRIEFYISVFEKTQRRTHKEPGTDTYTDTDTNTQTHIDAGTHRTHTDTDADTDTPTQTKAQTQDTYHGTWTHTHTGRHAQTRARTDTGVYIDIDRRRQSKRHRHRYPRYRCTGTDRQHR